MRSCGPSAALAAVLLLCAGAARAGAAADGATAPAFDLPALEGGRLVSSTGLFASHAMTFVVFWDGGCPTCVESLRQCQLFYERVEGSDVGRLHW